MYIESFKDLVVWQKGMELSKLIYKLTTLLPKSEIFSMINQMRRAAYSIPCNIAEGKKRRSSRDFCHFLRMADGSAAELETQILLAQDLYPNKEWENALELLLEIQKMLNVIIHKLEVKQCAS